MIDYAIYGKIIIDDIRLLDGSTIYGVLGGGGPQGAFGARLWADSVGFLSRSGRDMPEAPLAMLKSLGVDLQGWIQYADLPTLATGLAYDEKQRYVGEHPLRVPSAERTRLWRTMLGRPIALPDDYTAPRAIHLITEYWQEPMFKTALELREKGAVFSLEPLIDFRKWTNSDALRHVLPLVDIVTPDFPSASGIAGSEDPLTVMKHWIGLGTRAVAVRNSQHGSYVWDRDHDRLWHIPIVPVDVVDPTGAGNAYGGGWCVGWVETNDARIAGCWGAASASFLVERVGLPANPSAIRDLARKRMERALENAKPM